MSKLNPDVLASRLLHIPTTTHNELIRPAGSLLGIKGERERCLGLGATSPLREESLCSDASLKYQKNFST